MSATNTELRNYIVAYAAYVGALHVIDGPWKKWEKGTSVDMWTATHVAWGYIGAQMHQSAKQQLGLALINEGIEAVIRRLRPDLTWGTPEIKSNVPMDVLANMAGWYLGHTPKAPALSPAPLPIRSPVSVKIVEKYEETITEG
jgi:hypothetical protein